jgi:hypothetical protein
MSTAKATLDFDVSGFTSGEKALIESMARLLAQDKALKGQIEKKPDTSRTFEHYFENERKVKRNLIGLVSDLTQAGTATQALTMGAERLSETFKTGFGLAVGIGIVSTLAEKIAAAGEEIEKLDDKLAKLGSPQGSVQFQTLEQLQGRLKELQDFQTANGAIDPNRSPMRAIGQGYGDIFGGIGNHLAEAMADEGAGGVLKSAVGLSFQSLDKLAGAFGFNTDMASGNDLDDIINERSNRDQEARKLIEKQKDSIAEKAQQQLDIETMATNGGSQRDAAIAAANARYDEILGPLLKAGDTQNLRLVDVLKQKQANDIGDINFKADKSSLDLRRQEALLNKQETVEGLSPVEAAKINRDAAQAEMDLTEQRSKEERDIAEIKYRSAQLALTNAQREQDMAMETARISNEALEARLHGEARLSEIMTRKLNVEQQALKAERSGQPELAQQIRQQGQLQQEASDFGAAYDPRRGRLLSDRARLEAGQKIRRDAELQATSLAKFRRQGGLVDPKFDGNLNLVSGIDPNTGERRSPTPEEQAMIDKQNHDDLISKFKSSGSAEQLRMQTLGSDAEKAAAKDALNGSANTRAGDSKPDSLNHKTAEDLAKERFGDRNKASKEGAEKQVQADDKSQNKSKDDQGDAIAKMAEDIKALREIIKKWDSE